MTDKRSNPASPLIRIIFIVFIVLLAVYIPLKIHILRSESADPVEDGTTLRIYLTNELNCYREPCG